MNCLPVSWCFITTSPKLICNVNAQLCDLYNTSCVDNKDINVVLRYAMIYFPPKNIQILTDQGFSCVRVTDGAWLMPTHNWSCRKRENKSSFGIIHILCNILCSGYLQWKIQHTTKAIHWWTIWRALRSWLRTLWVEVCILWCWPWVTELGSWTPSTDWADPPQPRKSARRPASISGIDFIIPGIDFILFYPDHFGKIRFKINWYWAFIWRNVEINHTKWKRWRRRFTNNQWCSKIT